jgi:oligopeptide transport system permease protein
MGENTGDWEKINDTQRDAEGISGGGASYLKNALYRFSRRKTAVLSLAVVAFLMASALFGPFIYRRGYDTQNLSHINTPPLLRVYALEGEHYYISSNIKLIQVSGKGTLQDALVRLKDNTIQKRMEYEVGGRGYYINYQKNPPVLEDAEGRGLPSRVVGNARYILGTDGLGRDILIRLLYGARISLSVALVATLVNLIIGVLYGSAAGYVGGTFGNGMMRIVDIVSAIPLTLYVILIMVLFDSGGFVSIILALGLVYWVDMARVVRAQSLSLKERDFILAAKTMGSGGWYILCRHLIVNSVGPITVTATMQIPAAIFTEAFMSFIGLGVTAPQASWGTMCNDALEALRTAPYQLAFPAGAICLTMFAFNFIGDGLRDAFDPQTEG